MKIVFQKLLVYPISILFKNDELENITNILKFNSGKIGKHLNRQSNINKTDINFTKKSLDQSGKQAKSYFYDALVGTSVTVLPDTRTDD